MATQQNRLFALACLILGICAQPITHAQGLWARVPAPEVDSDARRCANWTDWVTRVTPGTDGNVTIEIDRDRPPSEEGEQPPFALRTDIGQGIGRKLTRRVDGGWLVAFNHGEYGGSLWWYSEAGTNRLRLASLNVVGFVDVQQPGRTIVSGVINGLAHLGGDEGEVAIVERRRDGQLTVSTLASLSSAPQVSAARRGGGALVVTNASVVELAPDGSTRERASLNLAGLYPGSVAEERSGAIVVGMRRYFVRVPPPPSAEVLWYTRSDCTTFTPDESVKPASCICK